MAHSASHFFPPQNITSCAASHLPGIQNHFHTPACLWLASNSSQCFLILMVKQESTNNYACVEMEDEKRQSLYVHSKQCHYAVSFAWRKYLTACAKCTHQSKAKVCIYIYNPVCFPFHHAEKENSDSWATYSLQQCRLWGRCLPALPLHIQMLCLICSFIFLPVEQCSLNPLFSLWLFGEILLPLHLSCLWGWSHTCQLFRQTGSQSFKSTQCFHSQPSFVF